LISVGSFELSKKKIERPKKEWLVQKLEKAGQAKGERK